MKERSRLFLISFLLLGFLLLVVFYGYKEKSEPLRSISKEIYGLYENYDEDKIELKIKSTVTQAQIDELYERMGLINVTEDNIRQKLKLVGLIRRAEKLLYEELPKEYTNRIYEGESEHWKITDYEIKATPVLLRSYKGVLYMKNQEEYKAVYFSIEVHMVIEGKRDTLLHKNEFASGYEDLFKEEDLELSVQSTGEFAMEHESYTNKDGKPIALKDITELYAIVKWQGLNEEELNQEKIVLNPQ